MDKLRKKSSLFFHDFEDDESMIDNDGDYFEEYIENETELSVGDGARREGISLAGTSGDKEALASAEDVCLSFGGNLGIYAFKILTNSSIQVYIERLTNKSGIPSMEDIEDEAELARAVPENITLEMSSPAVERVVRIPQDLDQFKDRFMM